MSQPTPRSNRIARVLEKVMFSLRRGGYNSAFLAAACISGSSSEGAKLLAAKGSSACTAQLALEMFAQGKRMPEEATIDSYLASAERLAATKEERLNTAHVLSAVVRAKKVSAVASLLNLSDEEA